MKKITYYLCLLFAVFLIPAEADTALLPHQGRVLLNGEPFDGIGYFRFALVSRNDPGSIRWNHQGGIDFPDGNITLPVNNGFYQVKLGDVSVPGMATLPDDLLTYEDPFSLRIWFGSQNTELQQLGPDQPLQIAPYAITTKWTSADEFASRFSNEIDNKANTENTTSDSIIERIISLGSKAPEEDFEGLIPMSMLDSELAARLDTFEQDINESKVNITSINLENASFNDSFEDLEDNMSSLDQGIQANASNLEDLNQSVSLHLGILDANVSSLDQGIQVNASNLEDLNQSVSLHLGILDANVSSLDQSIQVNASNLEDLNQSVSLHLGILDANVSSLDQGIQVNASNLEDLNQSVSLHLGILDANVSSLDQGIQVNASNLEDLNQSVSLHLGILDANVSSLDQGIQVNASNLEDLNQSVSLHLGILDANVSSLDQGIQVNASKLEDLNQSVSLHLGILDANVSSLDQGIQANASNLEDLNQSVSLHLETLENNISYVDNRAVTKAMLDDQLLSYLVPVITKQPYLVSDPSDKVYEGQSIEIHVGVDGRNLSYQWRKDDGNLSGETNSSLVLTNTNADQHDGNYSVEVRNIFGSKLSLSIELDINDSGTIGPLGSSHFVKSADNMELLWVPAGSFTMGNANDGETDNSPYDVTITHGFYLGKFEVTQSEYIAVTSSNPSWHRGASLPVERVSWDDINSSFLTTLNQSAKENASLPAGWSYALPSEAEWEFACRAGTEGNYSFGNTIGWQLANYNLDENRTLEPGSYPPNGFGFFDMHGNVAEWVMDIYNSSYYGSSPTDPRGPTTGDYRVIRGGSYSSPGPSTPSELQSSYRNSFLPEFKTQKHGFRLALKKDQ